MWAPSAVKFGVCMEDSGSKIGLGLLISDQYVHPNKAADVRSPHVCTLLALPGLLKNVKLVESSEFSNESKPALHYSTDSESRNLKEQDNNLCIEPSRQFMDQCDGITVGSPRRQLDSLLAGNLPQMASQVEKFGAFCPLVSMRSSSLQRALPIYLAFAFTSSNQSTFRWAMLQASAMSSHSKALTSSDGLAASSSASAAYHADVSTAGKYALAVGTVLLPIEVPLLISVHVSFVILILVSDTSGMSATSGTNKTPKKIPHGHLPQIIPRLLYCTSGLR